jgi:hypothetical protein
LLLSSRFKISYPVGYNVVLETIISRRNIVRFNLPCRCHYNRIHISSPITPDCLHLSLTLFYSIIVCSAVLFIWRSRLRHAVRSLPVKQAFRLMVFKNPTRTFYLNLNKVFQITFYMCFSFCKHLNRKEKIDFFYSVFAKIQYRLRGRNTRN